ncbi:MAG TPA: hypothetical protein VKQ70_17810 [Caulobacteraceae bacterium]|jgi:hypothetical protein|nr:hypothetical protein [Caulobacteraceae bacterium]
MITALAFAFSLMLADAPQADAPRADVPPPPAADTGEPLPPGAPTDSYQLSAWCYGALDEYLAIYERVKPDLRDIDHMFGTSVVEDEPYHSDMAAARVEEKMIAASVTEAEKASPQPISEQGAASVKQGRAIWSIAEGKPTRELARAWMLWALPDRCDSNAKELTQRSILFGKALNYNNQPAAAPAPADAAAPPPAATEPPAQTSPASDTNVPASPATDAGGAPAPTPDAPAKDPAVPPYPAAPGADQPAQATSPQP